MRVRVRVGVRRLGVRCFLQKYKTSSERNTVFYRIKNIYWSWVFALWSWDFAARDDDKAPIQGYRAEFVAPACKRW